MTTAQPATTASPENRALHSFPERDTRERTPWLLAFLCLLIPVIPTLSVPPGPLKSNGSPARLIALALAGLGVLGFILVRRTAKTRMLRPGVVVILMYFVIELFVYGVGISHMDSALTEANKTRAILVVLANVGVALYAMTRVESLRQRSIVLGCLAIGLTFNCLVGLLQNSTGVDLHLLFQPPGFITLEIPQINGGVSDAPIERFGVNRASGTSGHPIEFCVLAAATVPLTIHFARYAANGKVRLLALLAAIVALLAIPAGVSRSGVIALAAALLVYMLASTLRQLGVAVVTGTVVLLVGFVALPRTAQALLATITNSAEDVSVLERIARYAKVSQTFHEHPVFGLGLGGAPAGVYGVLDNEWLQEVVQGGVVGLTAMIVLAGGGIFGLAAAARSATTRRERDMAYAMGAMFIGILASTFTFDLFTFQQATLLFFILFGLLWSNFAISFPEATAGQLREGPFRAELVPCRNTSVRMNTDGTQTVEG